MTTATLRLEAIGDDFASWAGGLRALGPYFDLKPRRNWSDAKIAKELGMDADEVLRLKQITGLAEMFADREFSEAWEAAH